MKAFCYGEAVTQLLEEDSRSARAKPVYVMSMWMECNYLMEQALLKNKIPETILLCITLF
jgi:hypothetical protein